MKVTPGFRLGFKPEVNGSIDVRPVRNWLGWFADSNVEGALELEDKRSLSEYARFLRK